MIKPVNAFDICVTVWVLLLGTVLRDVNMKNKKADAVF